MNAKELLVTAKGLISYPDHWCKGSLATTRTGAVCNNGSPEAYRFCSVGALHRARFGRLADGRESQFNDEVIQKCHLALKRAISDIYHEWRTITHINDRSLTTHQEIMKVWDKAIELASQPE